MTIPRILHRVWVGKNPIPEIYQDYWRGWQEKHPGWEFHTWTDENIPPLPDPQQFALSLNPAMQSDFVRYEVVRRHGGVYIDTDFECLKNLEPLLEGVDFMTGWETNGKFLAGGLFGSTPDHSLAAKLSDNIGRNIRQVASEYAEKGYYYAPHDISYPSRRFAGPFLQSAQCGPLYFTNEVFCWLIDNNFYDVESRFVAEPARSGIRLCDEVTFYPWKPWEKGNRKDSELTHAIHHYAASWVE